MEQGQLINHLYKRDNLGKMARTSLKTNKVSSEF